MAFDSSPEWSEVRLQADEAKPWEGSLHSIARKGLELYDAGYPALRFTPGRGYWQTP